ncbi:MAG: hypothetical protein ACXWP5_10625 [Bdellovibrionota bacterium]
MLKILGTTMMLTALGTGAAAWAQDDNVANVTQATGESVDSKNNLLEREIVGILPQIGLVGYQDPTIGSFQYRAIYGFTADVDLLPAINPNLGQFFIGPTVGFLYSHLGDPGGGLFGSTVGTVQAGQGGANLLILPVDLKVGYNMTNWARLSAHGGGNVMYQSNTGAMNVSSNSPAAPSSTWSMFPNIGADLEFGMGRTVLAIRPDFTLTPENDVYSTTIALMIPIT